MLAHDETSENSGFSQAASSVTTDNSLDCSEQKLSLVPKMQQFFMKLWMFHSKRDKRNIMLISNSWERQDLATKM